MLCFTCNISYKSLKPMFFAMFYKSENNETLCFTMFYCTETDVNCFSCYVDVFLYCNLHACLQLPCIIHCKIHCFCFSHNTILCK